MVAVIKVQNMFCDHTNDAHRSSKQQDRISVCTWISEALKKHIQPFHASSNASLICLEHLGVYKASANAAKSLFSTRKFALHSASSKLCK